MRRGKKRKRGRKKSKRRKIECVTLLDGKRQTLFFGKQSTLR